jgi:hypothetical protein
MEAVGMCENNNSSGGGGAACSSVLSGSGGVPLDENAKRVLVELQRHWLEEYHFAREKTLVELTEKVNKSILKKQYSI